MDGHGIALVTGSSRGIGSAIAVKLASKGWDIAVNYRSDAAAADRTAARVRELGRRSATFQGDVSVPETARPLVEAVQRGLGPIDALVNNVGDFYFAPLAQTDAADWHRVIDSNLSSVHYMCNAVLPDMRARRRGRIVNIGLSTNYMIRAAANVAAYSIAKVGVAILTRSLATEEARHGILVNCVAPGLIDNGELPPAQQEWMERRVPLGRLGRGEEIGAAVNFLLSEDASYVSGAVLAVAGGWDWLDRPTDHDHVVHSLFLDESSGTVSKADQ